MNVLEVKAVNCRYLVVSNQVRDLISFTNVLFSMIGDECSFMTVDEFFDVKAISPTTLIFFDVNVNESFFLTRFKSDIRSHIFNANIVFINVGDANFIGLAQHWPMCRGMFTSNTLEGDYQHGIAKILEGDIWLNHNVTSHHLLKSNDELKTQFDTNKIGITQRELTLLYALMDGATNAQIADKLFISIHTVKTHLYRIYKKLGVSNRAEAISWTHSNLIISSSNLSHPHF